MGGPTRGLVSAGAMGTRAPAEILQPVHRTRPEKDGVVLIMIFYAGNWKIYALCAPQT